MRPNLLGVYPDTTTRALSAHRKSAMLMAIDRVFGHGLFAEAPAAPAGGAAPATGAPPASAPASASPAGGPAAPAAAAAAPGPAAAESLAALAPVIDPAAKPAEVVKPEDQKLFLIEKGGKAEDLDKLKPEELQAKYDEAKAAAEKPAAEKGELQIKVPEGITIDEKELANFKAIMSDDKMKPEERAQALVEMHAKALKAAGEQPLQLWFDTQIKWQGEVKADKELGGTNLDATRANMAKAVSDVMGPDAAATFEALKFTGAANHPAIVRLIARFSKAYVEGGPVGGAAPGSVANKDFASRVAAMYPSATGSQQAAT